jgi:hypothetical protein
LSSSANCWATVGYGSLQSDAACGFTEGRMTCLCSRTVLVRPVTPWTERAIVAGRRTEDVFW